MIAFCDKAMHTIGAALEKDEYFQWLAIPNSI